MLFFKEQLSRAWNLARMKTNRDTRLRRWSLITSQRWQPPSRVRPARGIVALQPIPKPVAAVPHTRPLFLNVRNSSVVPLSKELLFTRESPFSHMPEDLWRMVGSYLEPWEFRPWFVAMHNQVKQVRKAVVEEFVVRMEVGNHLTSDIRMCLDAKYVCVVAHDWTMTHSKTAAELRSAWAMYCGLYYDLLTMVTIEGENPVLLRDILLWTLTAQRVSIV